MLTKDDFKKIFVNVSSNLIEKAILAGVLALPALAFLIPPIRHWLLEAVYLRGVWLIAFSVLGMGVIGFLGYRARRLKNLQSAALSGALAPEQLPPTAEWPKYVSDRFLDVDWRWGWEGTRITRLQPICPRCKLNLYRRTESMDEQGLEGVWLIGFECHDCGFWRPFDDSEHIRIPEHLDNHVKDRIIREARDKGFPE
jgi:hypothetical protein